MYNLKNKNKYLYASPVGRNGKKYLKKIIKKFGHKDFDYLIIVYDNTQFNEKIFQKCKFIYDNGILYYLMKKYLIPKYLKKYDYLFIWTDDINIKKFSYKNFLEIFKKNKLEIAQPALTHNSYYGVKITLKRKDYKIGRFTNFVEVMVPVFTNKAWTKFWNMIKTTWNYWGLGYDELAMSFCKYKRMGIIDCEPVEHTRPLSTIHTIAPYEKEELFNQYKKYKIFEDTAFGKLK